ncbi:hypothetical protein ASF61_05625 [Duganella sp. Leaf126]|uniref:hypothetical protein n=1 Tax=Duganella sp. Leaf126 TaxID=1736266 RepID=UPI0006F72CC3|nr:hypothetical protein [Duganella sp. Leaf126]KQQ40258.1 hypothetical protein ASF61_05625 [Duganella sp. Leaf126]
MSDTTELTAAILTIGRLTLAVVLVPADSTYPEPGARLVAEAQRVFPTLPIMLVSPREGGFSRSYAQFDTTNLVGAIDTDRIAWRRYSAVADTRPAPF